MVKLRNSISFLIVIAFLGLLPSIGCRDQPPATLPIAEYKISERADTFISVFDSQYSCSSLLATRDLERGIRVINTGRELDCRNKHGARGGLIRRYLVEVEKMSERGEPFWVPEEVLEKP